MLVETLKYYFYNKIWSFIIFLKNVITDELFVSARNEITNAMSKILEGYKKGELDQEDINGEMFSNCLYTHESPLPELLIRTSGEQRLSDFLLWQVCTQLKS